MTSDFLFDKIVILNTKLHKFVYSFTNASYLFERVLQQYQWRKIGVTIL